MQLTDLNPKWLVFIPREKMLDQRHGMGISFDCPVCKTHKLAVMFSNPIDGGEPCKESNYLWTRTGDTYETLTLSPSIDTTQEAPPGNPHLGFGKCWHGSIKNGNVA